MKARFLSKFRLALLIVLSLALLEQELQAGQIQLFGNVIETIAEATVFDSTGIIDRQLQIDTFQGPFDGISRSNDFDVMNTVGGFDLSSSVSSEFSSNSSQIQIMGQGSAFQDIQQADPNLGGATLSQYITNLQFFTDGTTNIDWTYTAEGSPGPSGSSDGIDMRIKIRQWSDSSFSGTPLAIITNQFLGAGSATESFVLTPGFYDFILQGRVLYNSPNVSNRDGQATWSFESSVTAVPEPLTLDIKPGSDPNSINCNNHNGVIPVAILTTQDFDATTVDHTTVTFEGASETHVNRRSGEARRHEEDVDNDSDTDLVFHFRKRDTDLTCDSTEGTLTGETFGGEAIELTDSVRMVGGTTVITVGRPIPKGPKK